MTPEDVLKHDGRVLTRSQREFYFENGFMAAEDLIPREWTDLVRAASNERIEASRQETESGDEFDPRRSLPEKAHVRRIVLSTIIPFSTVSQWIAAGGYHGRSCRSGCEDPQLQD